jgi:hypothetical protein
MYYRLATYIVTSKPKRISVASGLVHIMFLLVINKTHTGCVLVCIIII